MTVLVLPSGRVKVRAGGFAAYVVNKLFRDKRPAIKRLSL